MAVVKRGYENMVLIIRIILKKLKKLKKVLGLSTIRGVFIVVLLLLLILAIYCIPSFAGYPPDGNTHIVYGQGLVEYSVPQKFLIDNNFFECQFTVYNPTHYQQGQATLRAVTDHFYPAWDFTEQLQTSAKLCTFATLPDLSDAQFHFMISAGDNNPSPQVGVKCWIVNSCLNKFK